MPFTQPSSHHHVPEAAFPFHCVTPVQIRFNDIDALGHVNNTVYLEFFDLGKTDYFIRVGEGPNGWGNTPVIIASVHCNFLQQTYFEEPVEVRTQVSRVGDKSLTLVQQLAVRGTQQVKCECTSVMVYRDLQTGEPAPVPAEWRQRISAFEKREVG